MKRLLTIDSTRIIDATRFFIDLYPLSDKIIAKERDKMRKTKIILIAIAIISTLLAGPSLFIYAYLTATYFVLKFAMTNKKP